MSEMFPIILILSMIIVVWTYFLLSDWLLKPDWERRSECAEKCGGLCQKCKDAYVEKRLGEIERELKRNERKEFERIVDEQVAEMKRKAGIS